MSTAQHKTLTDFVHLKNRNALCHVIRAANELGIFKVLLSGQRTLDQLAKEIDADKKRLGVLMSVLVQSELIEQYEDDFALSTLARLVPEVFYDFGDHYWRHLVGHVKTGSSISKSEHLAITDQDFLNNQASEEWMLTPAGMTTAQALDMGKSRKGLRILELGCGSGIVGVTLVHVDPTSHLTLVDTPAQIARARTTVNSIDVADRTTLIAAENWRDFEVLDLSGAEDTDSDSEGEEQTFVEQPMFDLVLLTRHIHHDTLETQKKLLKKIGALLLARGGEVVIVDVFPGQENGADFFPIVELEYGLRHSHGQLHHPTELEPALRDVGYLNVQFTHLPAEPYVYGLLLGEK